MEEVLKEYREGNFNFETGSLEFSCPRLELSIQKDEMAQGSFVAWTNEKRPIHGFVVSDSRRMRCLTEEFVEHTARIEYCFDATGLSEGEVHKGEINVITNQGEYYLPYVVTVEYFKAESSLGKVKNLFHFANLAKTNWEEAVALFYNPRFREILKGSDAAYNTVYEGFMTPCMSESNVEEFLLEIHKKQAVEYTCEKETLYLRLQDNAVREFQDALVLKREGWGYTRLDVTVDGGFLNVEKKALTEGDFIEDQCAVPFQVDGGKLHAGNNYGCITFQNVYQTISIPVTAVKRAEHMRYRKARMRRQYYTLHLMQYYLAMRMDKISRQTWLRRTGQLLSEWRGTDQKNAACALFEAQLLMAQERYKEARWILNNTPEIPRNPQEDPQLYCYYLYLDTLDRSDKAQVRQNADEIGELYRRNPGSWRIAWLLMYVDEAYGKSPSRKWMLLEEMFHQNCTSPLMYQEAVTVMRSNPTLLMKFTDFEIQVLGYAAKNGLLTEDVIRQIHYAASRMKHYSERMFKILKACYDQMQDEETLQVICTHLIKGNKTGGCSFPWYRLGVERELHITRLYEYFMMSVPDNYAGEIPKRVLMYFVYRSSLTYRQKAFLYAYIVKHEPEHPELYRTYLPDMEEFVRDQIVRKHVDKNLIYLYKKLLTRQTIKEYANEVIPLLFTVSIRTQNPYMKRVIVRYTNKLTEQGYPLVGGEAYVPLLGEEYKVFLEDAAKNRYRTGAGYETGRLLSAGAAIQEAKPYVTRYPDFDLYLCMSNRHYIMVDADNEESIRRLAANEEISISYRCTLYIHLADYYFQEDKMLLLDELLDKLEPDAFHAKGRAALIRYMVLRDREEKALGWIQRYGAGEVDLKTLMRLCANTLADTGLYGKPQMGEIACEVFRKGKYNEAVLLYLMQYFRGSTKQLRTIWKAAQEFESGTREFSKRLLIQMLFTGTYIAEGMQIFLAYLKEGADEEVEAAFLSYVSYEYFVREQVMEDAAFLEIQKCLGRGEALSKVTKLAYLKWLSEKKEERTGPERENAAQLIRELLAENIYFAFFKRFHDIPEVIERFMDKTILEYRARPDSRVVLHYLAEGEFPDGDEYHKEEIKHMYGGIFVKAFILFFGEKLQYYISEENNGREQLTQSGTLANNDVGRVQAENRYTLLNDIVTALALQDYGTVDAMLKEYGTLDFTVHKLFKMQ